MSIDWRHWQKLPEVRAFEAVCLMLNTNPPESPPDVEEQSAEYKKLLRVLLAFLGDRKWFTPGTLNLGDSALCTFRLPEVAAWALANQYALPAQFPRPLPSIKWHLWLHVPHVALWEAVALVLGIEPSSLRQNPPNIWMAKASAGPVFTADSFPSKTKQAEFQDAMLLAQRAANPQGPIYLRTSLAVGMNKRTAMVSLSEVAAFFGEAHWPGIPSELAQLGASQSSKVQAQNLKQAAVTWPAADERSVKEASRSPTGPQPLTTGDIAHCFAGLRWKTEEAWKKPLGDKPKWLEACIAIPGQRGVSETRWNPVLIGGALVRDGHVAANSVRARFQTKEILKPWLDEWNSYEAEYLATE